MYVLFEMQTSNGATAICPAITKADWQEAESEFHHLCSVAAVSAVQTHTILMTDEFGNTQRAEHYTHTPVEAAED